MLRGGSYLFVRWLYDRGGGDVANAGRRDRPGHGGPALVRAVLDGKDRSPGTLPASPSTQLADLAADFYTTLALSNARRSRRHRAGEPLLRVPADRHRPGHHAAAGADVYATFHGMMMHGPKVQPVASADGKLRAGGVDYVAIDAKAGQPEIAFTLQVDPKAKARVRVGRLR